MSIERTREIIVGNETHTIDFAELQQQRQWLFRFADPQAEGLVDFISSFMDASAEALGDEGDLVVFGRSRKT